MVSAYGGLRLPAAGCCSLITKMIKAFSAAFKLPAVRLGLGYAVGCIAAASGGDVFRIVLLCGAAVLTGALFVMHKEKLPYIGILLGALAMSGYVHLYCRPLESMSGSTVRTTMRVTSVKQLSGAYSVGRAFCFVNGYPAVINFSGTMTAKTGDVIDAEITIAQADEDIFTFSDGVVIEGGINEIHAQTHTFSLLAAAEEVRSDAANRLDSLGGEEAELCKGLLLGDTSGFSMKLEKDVTYSGLNYMTAVSGAHITLVLMILMELFGKGKRTQAVVTLIAVPVLAVLYGFSASVMRAGIMMLFSKCAPLFSRRAEVMNSLCSAFLALTIFAPCAATDPALQMSSLGVFGVAVLGRGLNNRHRFRFERFKVLAKIKQAAVISLCSMICIAPVSVSCFGGISLAEVPASVAATPFFTAAVALGLLYLLTGVPLLAVPLFAVMKGFCVLLGFFGGIPGAWLPAEHAAMVPLAFLSAGLLVAGVLSSEHGRRLLQCFALSAVLFVCLGLYSENTRSRIDFVSDGRSGAAVVIGKNEASVMISGTGAGRLSQKLFSELMRCGVTHINLVNAPQLEYAGAAALEELAELYPADKLLTPSADVTIGGRTPDDLAADSLTVNGKTLVSAKAGDTAAAGDMVMYWSYKRSAPENSAGIALYVSAWQNQLPENGVNIYDEKIRIEL